MKKRIRLPLMIALALIVIRIPLEELGAPGWLTIIFGVNWLVFLVPIYFAWEIASARGSSPFKELFFDLAIFNVVARLMIAVTYVLSYFFRFSATRFSVPGGGPVGEGVTALNGIVTIPATGFLIGTIAGIIIGMILGGIALLVFRKK